MMVGIHLLRQMLMRSGAALSVADTLLGAEAEALTIGFSDRSLRVVDTGTPANDRNYAALGSLDTFSSWFTYTSPSPKMIRHSDGLLKYAAHNLMQYSQDFSNAVWSNSNSSETVDTTTAPDSTSTADTITASATSGRHIIFQSASPALVNGSIYNWSCYLKAGTTNYAQLQLASGTGYGVVFDLSNGTIGNTRTTGSPGYVGSSIESIGSGWYRCSVVTTHLSGTSYAIIAISNSATPSYDVNDNPSFVAAGTETIYAWGAQVTRFPCDNTYMPNLTSGNRYALPLEYDASAVALGLLVETSRTNLCLRSNDFSLSWSLSNITQAKTATGPDGVSNNATTLTSTAANGTATQLIVSASAARISSCWIKRRTGTGNIQLTTNNGTTWTTVTVTSDWTRVIDAGITNANPTVGIRIVTSGDEVDVARFQNELGTYPSSPIETFSTSVTRTADTITKATSAFPYQDQPGTMFVKFAALYELATDERMVMAWRTDGSNLFYMQLRSGSNDDLTVFNTNAGSNNVDINSGDITAQVAQKFAVAWATNDLNAYVGGFSIGSDATCSFASVTDLKFGHRNTDRQLDGHIKEVLYLPRRMTNGDLGTLTT